MCEFNFGNGIIPNARKTSCRRDWDGVWSRFLSHEVTQGHAGPPWPQLPPGLLPASSSALCWDRPVAPPPSLCPGIQISASSSAVLSNPYCAVPTQATGAPARGHTTSLCLSGVCSDSAVEPSLARRGHPSSGLCICSLGPLGLHGGPAAPCPASTGPAGTARAPLLVTGTVCVLPCVGTGTDQDKRPHGQSLDVPQDDAPGTWVQSLTSQLGLLSLPA